MSNSEDFHPLGSVAAYHAVSEKLARVQSAPQPVPIAPTQDKERESLT